MQATTSVDREYVCVRELSVFHVKLNIIISRVLTVFISVSLEQFLQFFFLFPSPDRGQLLLGSVESENTVFAKFFFSILSVL